MEERGLAMVTCPSVWDSSQGNNPELACVERRVEGPFFLLLLLLLMLLPPPPPLMAGEVFLSCVFLGAFS